MAVGISVEFCSHLTRAFSVNIGENRSGILLVYCIDVIYYGKMPTKILIFLLQVVNDDLLPEKS